MNLLVLFLVLLPVFREPFPSEREVGRLVPLVGAGVTGSVDGKLPLWQITERRCSSFLIVRLCFDFETVGSLEVEELPLLSFAMFHGDCVLPVARCEIFFYTLCCGQGTCSLLQRRRCSDTCDGAKTSRGKKFDQHVARAVRGKN